MISVTVCCTDDETMTIVPISFRQFYRQFTHTMDDLGEYSYMRRVRDVIDFLVPGFRQNFCLNSGKIGSQITRAESIFQYCRAHGPVFSCHCEFKAIYVHN